MDMYVLSPSSITHITLIGDHGPSRMLCNEVSVAKNDVVVAEGNIIGAVLPDENPIRVLYTNSPYNLSEIQNVQQQNFSGYEVETLYQVGLNIRAYIGKEFMITNSTRYKME